MMSPSDDFLMSVSLFSCVYNALSVICAYAEFNIVLNVLCIFRNEEPSVILTVLKSLSNVRRFDMAVMFMSSAEKKGIKNYILNSLFTKNNSYLPMQFNLAHSHEL